MFRQNYHKHETLLFEDENCEYELGAWLVRSSTAPSKTQNTPQNFLILLVVQAKDHIFNRTGQQTFVRNFSAKYLASTVEILNE